MKLGKDTKISPENQPQMDTDWSAGFEVARFETLFLNR
jgi:hypothetical protein